MARFHEAFAFAALFSIVIPTAASAVTKVVATPNFGHPKAATQVSGTGFGANEAVDVYFDTTDEFLAVTNASGSFPAHELDVPKSATPGKHWITAVGRKTGDAAQIGFGVGTNWVQYGFDTHLRSRNPYENVIDPSNVGTLDLLWSHTMGDEILFSSPAYVGGLTYVGSLDDKLYALTDTGAVQWTATAGGGIESSPAVAKGNVYVGCNDGKIYAFNAQTGALVWSAATGAAVTSSPTVAGNVLYVGSEDDRVYALNASTGAAIWSTATGAAIDLSSPAVVNGVVYIGSTDDKLYALNAATGTVLWTVTTGGSVISSPAVMGTGVYFGSNDGKLYAVDTRSGGTDWTYTTGASIASSPVVVNGAVFVAANDGKLYAIHTNDGSLKWSTPLGGFVGANAVSFANGVGYVGTETNDGNIYAFDPADGSILWSSPMSVDSRPAIANGILYIGSDGGDTLYAFALDGGFNAAYKPKRTPPSYSTLHPDFRLNPSK